MEGTTHAHIQHGAGEKLQTPYSGVAVGGFEALTAMCLHCGLSQCMAALWAVPAWQQPHMQERGCNSADFMTLKRFRSADPVAFRHLLCFFLQHFGMPYLQSVFVGSVKTAIKGYNERRCCPFSFFAEKP